MSNRLTFWARLLATAFPLAACAATPGTCADPGARPVAIAASYGGPIEFEVTRNGEPVGRHVTTFTQRDGHLAVKSELEIALRVLFITIYRYHYVSEDLWCGGRLAAIDSRVDDNGERFALAGRLDGERFVVTAAGAHESMAAGILATNHWNPDVLGRHEVLNTLTGRLNRVTLTPCGGESLPVGNGTRAASCFDYTGDLQARVWYDAAGRWTGLQFAGRDGSPIRYTCRRCGEPAGGGA